MKKITEKSQTFRGIYNELPKYGERQTPRKDFVARIAEVTMKNKKTVYCWLAGTQNPDPLSTSMIVKELDVPAHVLFPERYSENEIH